MLVFFEGLLFNKKISYFVLYAHFCKTCKTLRNQQKIKNAIWKKPGILTYLKFSESKEFSITDFDISEGKIQLV